MRVTRKRVRDDISFNCDVEFEYDDPYLDGYIVNDYSNKC